MYSCSADELCVYGETTCNRTEISTQTHTWQIKYILNLILSDTKLAQSWSNNALCWKD